MTRPLQQLEGKYEVLRKLKEGGMGAIYEVRHRLLGETRVVKVMRPHVAADPALRGRFQREARVAIRVRHPNIAQLFDYSMDEEGTAIIVMEFIDGVTLQEVIRSGELPSPGLALEIGLQVLQALSCLHHTGIVHRDISSDNVMLTRSYDGRPLVKLIDLGIAKDPLGEATATAAGTFLGKARYSAPEQFRSEGAGALGPASDLYSFGVLLYELLTGRLPVEGESFAEIASGHLFQPPVPFERSDPGGRIRPELREILFESLAKDPAERIGSTEEMIDRLRPFAPAGDAGSVELEKLLQRVRSVSAESVADPERGVVDERSTRQIDEAVAHIDRLLSLQGVDRGTREIVEVIDEIRSASRGDEVAREAEVGAFDERAGTREDREAAETVQEIFTTSHVEAVAERIEAPSGTDRAPDIDTRVPDRGRRRVGLALGVTAVIAIVALVSWVLTPHEQDDPVALGIERVLGLPEGSEAELRAKLESVKAMVRELTADGLADQRQRLEIQQDRIGWLVDLQRRLDNLVDYGSRIELGDAPEDPAWEAKTLWDALETGLQAFLMDFPGDPSAERLRDRGLEELGRLQERLRSPELERLLDGSGSAGESRSGRGRS